MGGRVGGVLWEHKDPTFSPWVDSVDGVLVRSGVSGGWVVVGRVWWGWWCLLIENQFFDEVSSSEKKIIDLMKKVKYEHQNSYDVVIFHFMNTHPPIKHIQSVTLSLYIYFGWFMGWVVGGDGMVGGFMVWVGVWWCGWWWGAWWGGWLGGPWGRCIYSPTNKQLQS